MRIPGTLTCDFCKERIDPDLPHPSLSVPMTLALRQKIADAMAKELTMALTAGLERGPAGLDMAIQQLVVPVNQVPANFKLEICIGCVEGFLPNVPMLLEEQVLMIIRRKIEVQRKRMQHGSPAPDDDDD